jgi:hypothetical protein
MTCHRKRVARACKPEESDVCSLRLPAGTVLNRCRRAIRRPFWRAVRGGLRAHRSMVLFHPGLQPRIVRHPLTRWRC